MLDQVEPFVDAERKPKFAEHKRVSGVVINQAAATVYEGQIESVLKVGAMQRKRSLAKYASEFKERATDTASPSELVHPALLEVAKAV